VRNVGGKKEKTTRAAPNRNSLKTGGSSAKKKVIETERGKKDVNRAKTGEKIFGHRRPAGRKGDRHGAGGAKA